MGTFFKHVLCLVMSGALVAHFAPVAYGSIGPLGEEGKTVFVFVCAAIFAVFYHKLSTLKRC